MSKEGGSLKTRKGYECERSLPAELQGQIGNRLREAYDELVREPVPDRFSQLLDQLKAAEAKAGGDTK